MSNPIIVIFAVATILLSFSSFFPTLQAVPQKNVSGFSLRLIHRDSPASPLYRTNLSNDERMKELIQMSNARVESLIGTTLTKNSSLNDAVIRPSMSKQSSLYLVKLGIGTFDTNPSFKTNYLELDSGSDLTWTQCEGCQPNCFPQSYPYFPKDQSKSYQPFPCTSCPPETQCNHRGFCMLQRTYGDGSTVSALISKETFTFESNDGNVAKINLLFGCGYKMINFKEGQTPNNKISGIFGMNKGPYSFLNQAQFVTKGLFSYCLQRLDYQGESPMYLRFGDDVVQTPQMKSTPLRAIPNNILYFLNLQGISIGGRRVDIPPEVFQIKSDGSGGTFIDSGAPISYMAAGAYTIFIKSLMTLMATLAPNVRKIHPVQGFPLCYERYKDPRGVNLPVITYHFENADFDIGPREAFYMGRTPSGNDHICLSIFQSKSNFKAMSILGVYQQVDKRIIYDLRNGQLLFSPEDCNSTN